MKLKTAFLLWSILNCLAGAPPAAPAATYWSAPDGSDMGVGSLSLPFATAQHGVDQLQPGDSLFLRQGVYHEAVTFPRSGTPSQPITVQAAPGECPVLDGAQPVLGAWSLDSGAVWRAPWPSQPQQVFCDGHLLNEARWPAAAVEGLSTQPVARTDWGCATAVACATLPPVDLTGAYLQIMAGQSWCAYTRPIAAHDAVHGVLSWGAPINALPALVPRRGDRFYVFGKRELLSSAGQWYWDPALHQLYVWAPDDGDPSGRIEAAQAGWLLTLDNRTDLKIQGLGGLGGGFSLHATSRCVIQDCHLKAPNWTRISNGYATAPMFLGGGDISGTADQWLGGSIRFAGRSGFHVEGSGHQIVGVTIEDCGWNWGNDGGIQTQNADQCLFQRDTVRRAARVAFMQAVSTRLRILDNLWQDVALYSDDVGAFDSWGTDGQGTEIAGNLIQGNHAMWGAGIYLDDNTLNFNVHDNVIQDVTWHGLTFKGVASFQNNTVLGAGHQAVYCVPSVGQDLTGAVLAHNQVKEAFPLRVSLQSPAVTDYGYHGGYAYLSAPGRVELDWAALDQPWWAVPLPAPLTQISAIVFSPDAPFSFSFSVSNLRYLPMGGSGDAGAVAVSGLWSAGGGSGSSAALTLTGPLSWAATGVSAYGGWCGLNAVLPGGPRDLSGYRGIAFDLSGTAARGYALQGCSDVDNGPDPLPGRGATLAAQVGADPASANLPCPWPTGPGASATPTPTPLPAASATPNSSALQGPPDLKAMDPLPNPGGGPGGRVAFQLLAPADEVRVSLYSSALVLIKQQVFPGPFGSGWNCVAWPCETGWGGGVHWLRMQAFRHGQAGQAAHADWYLRS